MESSAREWHTIYQGSTRSFRTFQIPETSLGVVRRSPANPRRMLYLAGGIEQRRDHRRILVGHRVADDQAVWQVRRDVLAWAW